MTEAEVVTAIRQHLEGLFPQACTLCQRQFPTFCNYLQNTEHQGDAIPYDAELGRWQPLRPIGTVTLANCKCGNTLCLSSHGMPLLQLWQLLNWARIETQKRQQSPRELLNYLREVVCAQVLEDGE